MRSETNKGCLRAAPAWTGAAICGCFLWLAQPALAARLGLAPLNGDGQIGRTTSISGAEFQLAVMVYTVTIRGLAVFPATVSSDVAGVIAPVTLTLPALPAGPQDVVLTGGGRTYTFIGAYQVARNICLSPAQGDGRAGMTYYDPAGGPLSGASLTGAWSGMVFMLEGWGFASLGTVAADTITVGGALTHHPQINVSATGRLQSTTIIVQSNLAGGRKDILVNDGTAAVFAGVYTVRRSIGTFPNRGTGTPGSTATIFLEGFGFADTPIAISSVTVNTAVTIHPAVTPVNGAFSFTLTIQSNPAPNAGAVVVQGETFANGYDAVAKNRAMVGLSPSVFSGLPNQAFQVEGMGNLGAGAVLANTMKMQDSKADSTTGHPGFTMANGRFPRMWVKASEPQEAGMTGVSVFDGLGARTTARGVSIKQSLCACPVLGYGRPGFSLTLSGFGFHRGSGVAANSITIGGAATTHAAITAARGDLPATTVTAPAMPFGDRDIVISDSTPLTATFAQVFHVQRAIGLTFVNGNGAAGELTALTGNGFVAGSIAVNSLIVGTAATHAAGTVAADGTLGSTALTLPALSPGAYDLLLPASQGSQAFAQAYRVSRLVSVAKHVNPAVLVSGTIATFTFSYTNTGVGDWAKNFSVLDTVPAGMLYAPGSAASTLPATIDWFSSACTCITAVEPAPANVVWVRWSLSGLVQAGASGQMSFKVTAQ